MRALLRTLVAVAYTAWLASIAVLAVVLVIDANRGLLRDPALDVHHECVTRVSREGVVQSDACRLPASSPVRVPEITIH